MTLLLTTVFIASLVGSLHCVGMCGPFALLAGSHARSRSAAIAPTLAYSLGRLVTYSVVGFVMGGLGMAVNQTGRLYQWQQSATYAAGGLMICVGVIALLRLSGIRFSFPSFVRPVQTLLQSLYQRTLSMTPLRRAFAIGTLTSLMPCGWLYTFGIVAAGTGNPFYGMVLMFAFWAGTVPIMAALMLGISGISGSIQKHLPVMMASLVVLLGVFTIAFREPIVLGEVPMQTVQDTESLVQQVHDIDHTQLPCCQTHDR